MLNAAAHGCATASGYRTEEAQDFVLAIFDRFRGKGETKESRQ
jgi:hypothetical protein